MTEFHIAGIWVALQFVAATAGLAAIVALPVALGYGALRRTNKAKPARRYWLVVAESVPFIFLLALVGGLTGQLGGGSKSSVVGEILPALMALFGPFLAYFLGSKRDPSGKVSVNALAFLLAFFVMFNVSAVWRQPAEHWAFCRDLFANADFDSELELRVREEFWWTRLCASVFDTVIKPTDESGAASTSPAP